VTGTCNAGNSRNTASTTLRTPSSSRTKWVSGSRTADLRDGQGAAPGGGVVPLRGRRHLRGGYRARTGSQGFETVYIGDDRPDAPVSLGGPQRWRRCCSLWSERQPKTDRDAAICRGSYQGQVVDSSTFVDTAIPEPTGRIAVSTASSERTVPTYSPIPQVSPSTSGIWKRRAVFEMRDEVAEVDRASGDVVGDDHPAGRTFGRTAR